MAGESQLISSVGFSQASDEHGQPSIENKSHSFSPKGIKGKGVSTGHLVAIRSASGRRVSFSTWSSRNDIFRFDFTPGQRPITSAGAINAPLFPCHSADLGAQTARPEGVNSLQPGPLAIISREGSRVELNLNETRSPDLALNFSWGSQLVTSAGGGKASQVGHHQVVPVDSLLPEGVTHPGLSNRHLVASDSIGRDVALSFEPSRSSDLALSLSFTGELLLVSTGFDSPEFGEVFIENTAEAIAPHGFEPPSTVFLHRAANDLPSASLDFDFKVVKNQSGANVAFSFYVEGEANIKHDGFGIDASIFGEVGFIVATNETITLEGIEPGGAGKPAIELTSDFIRPRSYVATRIAPHYIWNLRQYLKAKPFYSPVYGDAYVQGGVKTVPVSGLLASEHGKPVVINTTADQFAKLQGIQPLPIPRPGVSPRIVYPVGIFISGTAMGEPVVQFPPFPLGWESSRAGYPEIDYWTKLLSAQGIDPTENIGYPVIRDRAQEIQTPSILGTGVFGDIVVKKTTFIITVEGHYSFESSDFAEVRSNRRSIVGKGYDAHIYGTSRIWNKTPSFTPVGDDLSRYGRPAIGYWQRYIYGSGFRLDYYGKPSFTKTPSFAPAGIGGGFFGAHVVTHAIRTLEVAGKGSQKFGGTTIWLVVRRPRIDGFNASGNGKPRIEHFLREIIASGRLDDRYGNPRASSANRWIYPNGVFREFPARHTVGTDRLIKPLGYIATTFGSRIIPESQTLYAKGFAEQFGWPILYNQTQTVSPPGPATSDLNNGRWGKGTVYNLRQYIAMVYDPDSGLNPPAWPIWTLIENRSKSFGMAGFNAQRFGYAQIYNNARPITPTGTNPPEKPDYYESGMVSYRVRLLRLQGMEPPYISSWARAYNDAFVIAPDGRVTDVYGDADFENTRRYFNYIGGFKSERTGTPMVADRIREIVFERRYTIHPPSMWMPRVDLYTRYIEGIGDDLSGYGAPSLQIIFRKITPRWTHRPYFGWAVAWNVTPEVGARGRASDLYGDAFVRLEWRPLKPNGSNTQLFGRAMVADRDRTLPVAGIESSVVSDKLVVIRTGQPPYTDQRIDLISLTGKDEDGFGVPPPGDLYNRQVPEPSMNQYVLYAEGFAAEKFGNAFAQSNTIIIDDGINDAANGEPTVTLMLREIKVSPYKHDDIDYSGKPRVSPWTIWATPAPQQARENHPQGFDFHPVGQTQSPPFYPAGARFGRATVSTWLGLIRTRSIGSSSQAGKPGLQLFRRYLSPGSLVAYRNGWHSIDGGYRFVTQFNAGNFAAIGSASVEKAPYYGPQYLEPNGRNMSVFGQHIAEPLNRKFGFSGFDSLQMGTKRWYDEPYMWQGLRIGPLMPTIPEGFEATGWGDSWISHRVREVLADGIYAFVSEYQLEKFSERMKVALASLPQPPEQSLRPVGMEALGLGVPNVGLGVHYILPDGNANQYRKGAPN